MPYRFREPSLTIGRPGLDSSSGSKDAELSRSGCSGADDLRRKGGSQTQSAGQSTPKSFTRQLNGATIHYRQWGPDSALPLLLLHPGVLNSHVWDSFAPVVASRFRVGRWRNKTKTCKVSLRVALSSTSACTRAREANFAWVSLSAPRGPGDARR